ncbi:MAG: hypothetical protein SWO11_12295 [Thermodesulfobacteriota bacterium]|nr:hypothetical protein [Thermodesulfobacteriota bacterium]
MIKKLLLGMALGLILFFAFIYFGGARIITEFGSKTQNIGNELALSEDKVKRIQRKVSKDIENMYEKLKDWFEKRYNSSHNG